MADPNSAQPPQAAQTPQPNAQAMPMANMMPQMMNLPAGFTPMMFPQQPGATPNLAAPLIPGITNPHMSLPSNIDMEEVMRQVRANLSLRASMNVGASPIPQSGAGTTAAPAANPMMQMGMPMMMMMPGQNGAMQPMVMPMQAQQQPAAAAPAATAAPAAATGASPQLTAQMAMLQQQMALLQQMQANLTQQAGAGGMALPMMMMPQMQAGGAPMMMMPQMQAGGAPMMMMPQMQLQPGMMMAPAANAAAAQPVAQSTTPAMQATPVAQPVATQQTQDVTAVPAATPQPATQQQQPAAQPVTQPVQQATPTPVVQPVAQPVAQPVTQPTQPQPPQATVQPQSAPTAQPSPQSTPVMSASPFGMQFDLSKLPQSTSPAPQPQPQQQPASVPVTPQLQAQPPQQQPQVPIIEAPIGPIRSQGEPEVIDLSQILSGNAAHAPLVSATVKKPAPPSANRPNSQTATPAAVQSVPPQPAQPAPEPARVEPQSAEAPVQQNTPAQPAVVQPMQTNYQVQSQMQQQSTPQPSYQTQQPAPQQQPPIQQQPAAQEQPPSVYQHQPQIQQQTQPQMQQPPQQQPQLGYQMQPQQVQQTSQPQQPQQQTQPVMQFSAQPQQPMMQFSAQPLGAATQQQAPAAQQPPQPIQSLFSQAAPPPAQSQPTTLQSAAQPAAPAEPEKPTGRRRGEGMWSTALKPTTFSVSLGSDGRQVYNMEQRSTVELSKVDVISLSAGTLIAEPTPEQEEQFNQVLRARTASRGVAPLPTTSAPPAAAPPPTPGPPPTTPLSSAAPMDEQSEKELEEAAEAAAKSYASRFGRQEIVRVFLADGSSKAASLDEGATFADLETYLRERLVGVDINGWAFYDVRNFGTAESICSRGESVLKVLSSFADRNNPDLNKLVFQHQDKNLRITGQRGPTVLQDNSKSFGSRLKQQVKLKMTSVGNIKQAGAVHSGWLQKRGDDVVGAWKERYFVLDKEGKLWYFPDQSDSSRCKGFIDVKGCKLQRESKQKTYCFILSHQESGRDYVLASDSDAERQTWLGYLETLVSGSIQKTESKADTKDPRPVSTAVSPRAALNKSSNNPISPRGGIVTMPPAVSREVAKEVQKALDTFESAAPQLQHAQASRAKGPGARRPPTKPGRTAAAVASSNPGSEPEQSTGMDRPYSVPVSSGNRGMNPVNPTGQFISTYAGASDPYIASAPSFNPTPSLTQSRPMTSAVPQRTVGYTPGSAPPPTPAPPPTSQFGSSPPSSGLPSSGAQRAVSPPPQRRPPSEPAMDLSRAISPPPQRQPPAEPVFESSEQYGNTDSNQGYDDLQSDSFGEDVFSQPTEISIPDSDVVDLRALSGAPAAGMPKGAPPKGMMPKGPGGPKKGFGAPGPKMGAVPKQGGPMMGGGATQKFARPPPPGGAPPKTGGVRPVSGPMPNSSGIVSSNSAPLINSGYQPQPQPQSPLTGSGGYGAPYGASPYGAYGAAPTQEQQQQPTEGDPNNPPVKKVFRPPPGARKMMPF